MKNIIRCSICGHEEWWQEGNYFGEKTDLAHHWCGHPKEYRPCSPDCDHDYPGSAHKQGHILAGEFSQS